MQIIGVARNCTYDIFSVSANKFEEGAGILKVDDGFIKVKCDGKSAKSALPINRISTAPE